MLQFIVAISEPPPVIDVRVNPGGVSSAIRNVYWSGDAANEDAAIEAAWRAWDKKHGPGKQPVDAIVRVTS
jgi:hypothetical protein